MAGYICVAMLEDPPYNIILAATEEEPEDWLEGLPLPSHLLCYENFKYSNVILKQFIQRLKVDGIIVKVDKAFSALPHEVIRTFVEVRNEAENNNQLIKDMDEGERLDDLAREYEHGSNKIIPDLKKAFKLYMQAAELGYEPAYFSLAYAYFYGHGVKKDLNESLKWSIRHIDSGNVLGYYNAALCFVDAGMKEQASDMWRRCFKEKTPEEIQMVLSFYARHAAEGLVEQVHTEKIARLFGVVAEEIKDLAEQSAHWQGAVKWLLENQVTDSNFDDTDDAEAQFEIGQMYSIGNGVKKDDEQAVYWYRKAAEQGNPDAQFKLGEMYYLGSGEEHDVEQVAIWYRKAAEQGHVDAQYSLGEMYFCGEGLEEDVEQAAIWYRKAGEQGHVDAQYSLGEMYFCGEGLEQDFEQSAIWHRKAAEQGHLDAQYQLGYMFYHYEELEQYLEQAAYWLRKAAEKGVHSAQYLLANMYDEGHGIAQDDDQAITWYRKAAESSYVVYSVRRSAEHGSANAQYILHEFAEEGNVGAQHSLGEMYFCGKGLKQDFEQAAIWLRKAAEQSNEYAQCTLASMYYHGNGLEQDYEQAEIWYQKAAEDGSEHAQLILGRLYYIGEGLEQDDEQAIFWYRKASEQGSTDAQEALTGLGVDWENA